MKLEITKEECLRLAALEGDAEVGAGKLALDPTPSLWQEHEMLSVVVINLRIALRDALEFWESIDPKRLEILLTEVDRALATERNTSYQAGYKDGATNEK